MTNLKRIPFIPKLSREFKPIRHYLCETDTSVKLLSRSVFMRLLAQQPCPKGQVYIDFDDGIVYLFPFDPERAAQFTVAYSEFETEYGAKVWHSNDAYRRVIWQCNRKFIKTQEQSPASGDGASSRLSPYVSVQWAS